MSMIGGRFVFQTFLIFVVILKNSPHSPQRFLFFFYITKVFDTLKYYTTLIRTGQFDKNKSIKTT